MRPGKGRRNPAASARGRLLNLARERGEDFGLVLLRYALERFLYRLGCSEYREDFVLKGAMLHVLWAHELGHGAVHRPTRDLDLLAFGPPTLPRIERRLRALANLEIEPKDGLTFETDKLVLVPIREEDRYAGVRARFLARLGEARIPLQIDLGFGDAVVPAPQKVAFPTLLALEPPTVRVYARETVVAEKFHAMVERGLTNSRMKDFYDLDFLARHFPFQGRLLGKALRTTFSRRGTPLPEEVPIALTTEYLSSPTRAVQWKAFLKKSRLPGPPELEALSTQLRELLLPPVQALRASETFEQGWRPGGPWSSSAPPGG